LAALSISVPLRTGGLRVAAARHRPGLQAGQGQEMISTGEALLMAVTSRRVFASRLSAPGAAILLDAAGGGRVCINMRRPRPKNALICRR
jgi:hypothetical protein